MQEFGQRHELVKVLEEFETTIAHEGSIIGARRQI